MSYRVNGIIFPSSIIVDLNTNSRTNESDPFIFERLTTFCEIDKLLRILNKNIYLKCAVLFTANLNKKAILLTASLLIGAVSAVDLSVAHSRLGDTLSVAASGLVSLASELWWPRCHGCEDNI